MNWRTTLSSLALVGVTVGAMGVGGTLYAYAGWTVPSQEITVRVRTEEMPRGVTPSVAKRGDNAVVTWTAQEIGPSSRMDHYVVTAHRVGAPTLPDVTRTVAADGGTTETVTFTAAEVAGGTWYWTIVPKLRLWVGAESGKSQYLEFPGTPAAPPAGTPVARSTGAAPAATPTTGPVKVGGVPEAAANQPEGTSPATPPAANDPTGRPATTPATTAPTDAPPETGPQTTGP